jgi:hypothetical protein
MTCNHRKPTFWVYEEVEVSSWGDTEVQMVERGGESTQEDISIGAFRCTQCGEVGYYTGHWKKYFEEGVPCPGSDNVPRRLTKGTP